MFDTLQASSDPPQAQARDRVTVYEPGDWDKQIRRYYDQHPRGLYRVVQPIAG